MAPMSNLVTIFAVGCALSVVLLPQMVAATRGQLGSRVTCAAGTSAISIQEVFVDENGDSRVYCRGTATVRQCDGECFSQTKPKAGSQLGYTKLCNCCKEDRLEPKEVILSDCYDDSGNPLRGRRYPVQVFEPESCSCQRCSL